MLALAHIAKMMVPVWALSTITTIRPAVGFKIENDADCNNNGDGVGLLGWVVPLGLGLSRLSHYYFCCRAEYL